MKLEQFYLEKFIHGEKVFTRGGLEVNQLTKFETADKYNLYGIIDNEVHCWDEEGVHKNSCSNIYDLCFGIKPKRIWINIYRNKFGNMCNSHACLSKEGAELEKKGRHGYIKTIEITDEI
jgi:hypothetical protein